MNPQIFNLEKKEEKQVEEQNQIRNCKGLLG